jgi:hypothetical protein
MALRRVNLRCSFCTLFTVFILHHVDCRTVTVLHRGGVLRHALPLAHAGACTQYHSSFRRRGGRRGVGGVVGSFFLYSGSRNLSNSLSNIIKLSLPTPQSAPPTPQYLLRCWPRRIALGDSRCVGPCVLRAMYETCGAGLSEPHRLRRTDIDHSPNAWQTHNHACSAEVMIPNVLHRRRFTRSSRRPRTWG